MKRLTKQEKHTKYKAWLAQQERLWSKAMKIKELFQKKPRVQNVTKVISQVGKKDNSGIVDV